MSYQKPELLVLSLAASSVRSGSGEDSLGSEARDGFAPGQKLSGLIESSSFNDGITGNRDLGAASSTTSPAYEADE